MQSSQANRAVLEAVMRDACDPTRSHTLMTSANSSPFSSPSLLQNDNLEELSLASESSEARVAEFIVIKYYIIYIVISIMKGGLLINSLYLQKIDSIEEAINIFKSNSTFSILTNNSMTCITFKATLKKGFDSPLIHIRSGIIDEPVTTLLFKYFPISPYSDTEILYFYTNKYRGRKRAFIELSQAATIETEYDIQLRVYNTTYNTISSAYEPVCPFPISCSSSLDKDETIQEILYKLDDADANKENDVFIIIDTLCGNLDDKLIEDQKDDSHFSIDQDNTPHPIFSSLRGAQARGKITTLGCIVMEYMDGYITLKDYLTSAKHDKIACERAVSLAAYEVVRLKHIGFIHGDLVYENIMYNPDYKYITDNDKNKGRALLIDFGKALIDKQELYKQEQAWLMGNLEFMEPYTDGIIVYEDANRYLSFYPPYTFKMIYERRLDSTLQFRKKIFESFEDFLKEYRGTRSTRSQKDKDKLLKTSRITLEKINDFINPFLYPTTFSSEEFTKIFNIIKKPIFESKVTEIRLLETKATAILGELRQIKELVILLNPAPTKKLGNSDPIIVTNKKMTLRNSGKGIRINYKKKHKLYNKRFPYSLPVNQYNGNIKNTLKIKYKQTKKRKRKKK